MKWEAPFRASEARPGFALTARNQKWQATSPLSFGWPQLLFVAHKGAALSANELLEIEMYAVSITYDDEIGDKTPH